MRSVAGRIAAWALAVGGALGAPGLSAQEPVWTPLFIADEQPRLGVFDPSIAEDPKGGFVMSYSSVAPSAAFPKRNPRVVSIHLARSADARRWRRVAILSPARDAPASNEALTWNTEVSSLAVDPSAPPNRAWRLTAHRFPLIDGDRRFEHGWISLVEASAPERLAAAPEIKLLVGRGYKADPKRPFPNPAAPVLRGHEMHRDLSRCAAFTEPALLARRNALHLAVTCAEFSFFSGVTPKIVLFRCGPPCRATRREAWVYVGELLGAAAARRERVKAFTAASWVSRRGRDFLIATPLGDEPFAGAYKGCRLFAVRDLDQARLSDRSAVMVSPGRRVFEGACAASGTADRLLSSRLRFTPAGPRFTIRTAPPPDGFWTAASGRSR